MMMHAAAPHPVRWTLAALLLCSVSACGFGSAGVASALGKGNNTRTRAPTQLTLLTPANGQTGRVTLQVGLDVDPNEALEIVSIEYALGVDVVAYRPATPALGFPSELAVAQEITGTQLAARASKFVPFVWNSHHDLDTLRRASTISRPVTARASMRVSIKNTKTQEVLTRTTSDFYLDHSLIATVAGGGVGDGTSPSTASMLDPVGIATNGLGEVYVADSGNHRIRKIVMSGLVASSIETVIGNGFQGTHTGTRAATLTSMNTPVAVAIDAGGNLFVAESNSAGGSQLRAYERQTGLVFDLLSGFRQVSSLFMTASRKLYVADQDADSVWLLDLANVDPFLAPPAFASLQLVGTIVAPTAVTAVEDAGVATVYVAKRTDRHVVRVQGSGAPTVVAGGGTAAPAIGLGARDVALDEPAAIAATPTLLMIADKAGGRVLVVDANTLVIANVLDRVTSAGSPARPMQNPSGLTLDALGNAFVVETGSGSLTAGSSGHQVLVAHDPASPAQAAISEVAAGAAPKQPMQVVAEVRRQVTGYTIEQTTAGTG